MPIQPSFTRYYWIALLAAFAVWLAISLHFPLSESFGVFALVTGLGSAYVYSFEFGRLMGFLKVHAPSQYAELQDIPLFETLAFVHPRMHRKLWVPVNAPLRPRDTAFRVYRSAWIFSALTIGALLLLVNTLK
ncbi:hypothetical protein SDC9_124790 [bioreactor metagenome]|uniref:Uncharacterized protein n=1 Tax=bioreactor metagenome TaxID=1076179 RepID=A0A645CLX7_9ZZZZ